MQWPSDPTDVFWYLAGPMSNLPQFNVPAFLWMRDMLEARGLRIQLPADLDDPEIVEMLLASDGTHGSVPNVPTWGECLALDVKLIADVVGGVLVMEGWEKSRGARLETFVCVQMCSKPVGYATIVGEIMPVPMHKLVEAWLGDDLFADIMEQGGGRYALRRVPDALAEL